ncbi:hypothetical protein OsJ_24241 [Oryza sativa Japonica Group]|uniref:Uncharacterized protein n=1 Tax=Oryza sativa subsp. japonica TaxID=39947 RepID=Q8GVR9_ORYSJ|nr:hypothetical protein OsJ_24241 [Oryza sativa Japonica Group]BAC45125.1 hypothetical protein [Oryza sativa Japonica Group]
MATNNGGEEMKVESGVVGEVGGEEEGDGAEEEEEVRQVPGRRVVKQRWRLPAVDPATWIPTTATDGETFYKKNTPFRSLKSVRADELEKLREEPNSNNTRPAWFRALEPRDSLGPAPLFCGTDSLSRLHRSRAMAPRYRLDPAVQSCGTGSVAHPGST